MRKALLTVLLLAAPLWAAKPAVKITEKLQVDAGDWIVLTAETDAKGVEFYPVDAGIKRFPPQLVTDPKTFVATAPPGVYRVLCYAGNADGASIPAVCMITVGTPPPPPPPVGACEDATANPLAALCKASRAGYASVADDYGSRKKEAVVLAGAMRELAAGLTPANYPQTDPAQLAAAVLAARRAANNTAVGDHKAQWAPWAAAVDPVVESLYNSGRLKTPQDWAAALTQIAKGLN